MTIREWAMDYCLQRGMPPPAAKAVLQRLDLQAKKAEEEMQCPWEWDTTDEYSVFLLEVLSIMIDHAAVAWTEQNCPEAWYTPMFDRTAKHL